MYMYVCIYIYIYIYDLTSKAPAWDDGRPWRGPA